MASNARAVSTWTHPRVRFPETVLDDGNHPGSGRQIVAALILLVALVAAGLWLAGAMRGDAAIQDCVAAGRTNCAPIR